MHNAAGHGMIGNGRQHALGTVAGSRWRSLGCMGMLFVQCGRRCYLLEKIGDGTKVLFLRGESALIA